VTLTDVTVSGNTAPATPGTGGGISVVNTAVLNATRTIVAGNINGDLSGNGINGTNANNLTSGNPLLAPLGTYGGTTATRPPLPGSPAIDAGGTGCTGNDQRGVARPVNGACDIGAAESQGFTLTPVVGSTPQSTADTTAFPNPLAVTVTSGHGDPVDGGQVAFTATPGGGGQSATLTGSPATIAGGAASVTATANGALGGYTVAASTAGATDVTFRLTNIPGPASTLTPSPNTPQSATVATAFPTLSVAATDAGGNPVADGTQVTFTVTPAGNGASVTFSNSGSATTTGGVASITATANTIAGGPSTVTATSNGHTATFSLTNLPGAAATLAVTGYPSPVVAGTAHPFTVTAFDQFGNTATGYTGTVHFTSTDPLAAPPADYPFVAADAGVHSFSARFGSAGTWSLMATDTRTSTITGTQTGIVVTAAPLVSIAVTPGPVTLKVGQMQQFTATGTYADSTTADITSQVTWSSGATSIASVDATGMGAGQRPGTAPITATLGSVSGQASVTVSALTLTGVAPAPQPASRPAGTTSEPSATPAPSGAGRSGTTGGASPVAVPTGR
jgi:hypothetical protein